MDEFKDVHGNPLQEGFYLRRDRILLTYGVENIVYVTSKNRTLYQESLFTSLRPLQVSSDTTFQPLSQKDLDWLRERLDRTRLRKDLAFEIEDALIDTS